MAWNISNAIQRLVSSAHRNSQHQCAKYVRLAIEAGGISTAGRPGSAYLYKNYLPSIGFNLIGKIHGKQNQLNWTRNNAQIGDIAVMDHGEHGHICMWSGRQWISDFIQSNMWVYSGDGTCYIYRYNGVIDGSLSPFIDFDSTGLIYKVPLEQQRDHQLFNALARLKRNLLMEIIEYFGDFNVSYDQDIIYHNFLSMDESSLSESLVEQGLFFPGDYNNTPMDNPFTNNESHDYQYDIDKISVLLFKKRFGGELSSQELNGMFKYSLSHNHLVYGYNLVVDFSNNVFLDDIKKSYTKQELEMIFSNNIRIISSEVKSWIANNNIMLNSNQITAIICACYSIGRDFLRSNTAKMIAENPFDPKIYNTWINESNRHVRYLPSMSNISRDEVNLYFGRNK